MLCPNIKKTSAAKKKWELKVIYWCKKKEKLSKKIVKGQQKIQEQIL